MIIIIIIIIIMSRYTMILIINVKEQCNIQASKKNKVQNRY